MANRYKEGIVFESSTNALSYYFEFYGIKNSKFMLREMMVKKFLKKEIDILDVSLLLNKLNIRNEGYSLEKLKMLSNFKFPIFTLIINSQNKIEFIVIKEITSNLITYTDSYGILKTESKLKFLKLWQNVILDIQITAGVKKNIKEYIKNNFQKQEEENYRKSIKTIPDFLSLKECDFIIKYCEDSKLFERSEVSVLTPDNSSYSEVSSNRTSYSASMKDRKNKIFSNIYEKVSKMIGMNIDKIESLQCVKYSKGAFFLPHFDADKLLNRKYTILVYLNENFSGGETYFPELKKYINPKTGYGLLFENINSKKRNLIHSVHAGMPVNKGVKYACNIWIRTTNVKL
jgi:hypothetical protein